MAIAVYSSEKPARPWRARVISVTLFLLTCLLAATSVSRSGGFLRDADALPGWEVQFKHPRSPAGPTVYPLDSGEVVIFDISYAARRPASVAFWRVRVEPDASSEDVARRVLADLGADDLRSRLNELLGVDVLRTGTATRPALLGKFNAVELQGPSGTAVIRATTEAGEFAYAASVQSVDSPLDSKSYALFESICATVEPAD